MPRAKKKPAELPDSAVPSISGAIAAVEAAGDAFEPTPQMVVEQVAQHVDAAPHIDAEEAARKNWKKAMAQKVRTVRHIDAGDVQVKMVDHGNKEGIGIRAQRADGNDLTPEQKKIVSETVKAAGDHHWDNKAKFWKKPIGEDSPPKRAIAIRYGEERLLEEVAAKLQGGYTAREEERKEQRQEAGQQVPF